ncbi:LCP family protein, partial [Patescibacteria group bacterium]|nr:LCP family protein [Patescibacteria group bacterium]
MESIKTFSCRRAVIFFCLILVMGFGALYVFASQIKSVFQPRVIEIKNNGQAEKTANAGAKTAGFKLFGQEAAEPVNFLLLGAPGLGNDGADLTDTILLARLDEAKNKIYLFSLPRDLLVKIPGSENYTPTPNSQLKNSETEISSNSLKKDSVWGYTKLNALYAFNKNNAGREFVALIAKSQNITGLTINHYVFVDLQTVRQLVDIFGGVNVMVAKDILDPAFPGPNHSFETFEIKSGWRYLDGQTAL